MSTNTEQEQVAHTHGKVVVITGAGGGIGAALVERFLQNRDRVIASDRSAAALDALPDDLAADGRLITVPGSIDDEDDMRELVEVARAQGGVDVFLNVAGFFPFDAFADTTLDRWRAVVDVNLTGYFLVTHELLPLMTGRGWGRIVNVGSASMFPGVAGQVHYVSAKSGLVGFTRSLAREIGGEGITVNLLTPGLTLTKPVLDHFPPELIQRLRESRALERDQYAADLVGPIFFLASPDADFITGQTLNVDGGAYMN